jgi:hypothetical protein
LVFITDTKSLNLPQNCCSLRAQLLPVTAHWRATILTTSHDGYPRHAENNYLTRVELNKTSLGNGNSVCVTFH